MKPRFRLIAFSDGNKYWHVKPIRPDGKPDISKPYFVIPMIL